MASSLYEETVARIYTEYERRKRDAGALDFDDLISETVRLFRDHPEVLKHYQERFRYILIDEYQDTNRAQYELVNMLAAKYRNICVVGDADQGVYSWRGATIQNILDFERDYPDAAVFLMEQNYRSTQNILTVANALIENNVQRKPKNLWTEAGSGRPGRTRSSQRRAQRGVLRRTGDRASPERGGVPLPRRRDLLPHERAVARDRGRPDAGRDALPSLRRGSFLPAEGDQGRPRVPPAPHQSAGRDLVPAGREHAEAGDRRCHGGRAGGVRAGRGDRRDGGVPTGGRDRVARLAGQGSGRGLHIR